MTPRTDRGRLRTGFEVAEVHAQRSHPGWGGQSQ
jgi:hypothetical protein